MVSVFLVEDEVIIRNGIKNSINWEKAGLTFAGEASDGEIAYPLIKKTKPDILITDIKMPFMDGLELSRRVKEDLPDIKILILSGYGEFDYAKEAISIGVTDYLLKPVTANMLLEILIKTARDIEEERTAKEEEKENFKSNMENVENDKFHFFNLLVSGNVSMSEALDDGRNLGLDLSAGAYNLILFQIVNHNNIAQYSELAVKAYDDIEQCIREYQDVVSFRRGVEGWAFLCMGDSERKLSEEIANLQDRIKEVLKPYDGLDFFGGIGKTVLRIRELNESFREADRVFAMRFTLPNNQILSLEETKLNQENEKLNVQNFDAVESSREQIQRFLLAGTEEEIDSFASVFMEKLPKENIESNLMRHFLLMEFYSVIIAYRKKLEIHTEELSGKDIEEIFLTINTFEAMEAFISEEIRKTILLRDGATFSKYKDVIEKAKKYINENYMQNDISLNKVASAVNVSPSYFSSIFSRETKQTFVEYLTEVRMERAKMLLMGTVMKSSEIAFEVGYRDAHYFSYLFKKTQGCTPKEYRGRGRNKA